MPPVLRGASVAIIAALVAVLVISFRYDPHDIRSATVGKPAPSFVLAALDGNGRVDLAAYRGKVVVVNFWASWCVPCKQEHAALADAWERYRTANVVLVGVLYQDSADAGREFVARMGGGWPTGIDENGRTALAFGVFGIPETFFIGPDGVISGRHIGPVDGEILSTAIEALRARAAVR
jgi:cytochrome c biogenesis protein CcmG/thiol:disulfide interchange protein DsbE